MAEIDDNQTLDDGTIGAIGGIGGAIPGLNIITPGLTSALSSANAEARRKSALRQINKIALPEFSQNDYSQVAYAGDLAPQLYGTPEAAQAELAQMDPQTLAARRAAIEQLYSAGNGAAAAQEDSMRRQALYDSANQAGAQSAGLREEMAARGKGGAGAEFAMRQRAGQAGANQAMLGGLQANAQGAQQRLAAMSQYENSLGGLSDDQQAMNTHNSDLVSQFNMANANLRNQTNFANTGLQNEAQARNLGARQQNTAVNTGLANSSLDRNDTNKLRNFQAQVQKTGMLTGQLNALAAGSTAGGQDARAAGQEGYSNFKDLMSFGAGGGGGGGAGGMMGKLGGM